MSSLHSDALGHALRRKDEDAAADAEVHERSLRRAQAILKGMNPVQRAMALDPNPLIAGLCPRRAGKSYAATATALAIAEAKPHSVVLIISLNLKMTKRNYWQGTAASGLHAFNRRYKLNLEFNTSDLRWEHENGSVGYLLGCDTQESLENMRGLEADAYIVDECKSFAPQTLRTLFDDIIEPQQISRAARVFLIGTPGSALASTFYEATCPLKLHEADDDEFKGMPYCVPAGQPDPYGRNRKTLWSLHRWTLKDNVAMPDQWEAALAVKSRRGWADDHPSWRREYLGEWVQSSEGLVFSYSDRKVEGSPVNWRPAVTPDNPSGLPQEQGPWRFVWGMDLGFEDPTALVIAAYSTTHRLLREVKSIKAPHMNLDQIEEMLEGCKATYGQPERIFADTGGLGKLLVETLCARGWFIEAAKKADKNDAIELVNADFQSGRIQVIENSELAGQLETVPWDMSNGTKAELAKTGRLREDKAIPNDVTDAFLYLHRGCHHLFSVGAKDAGPLPGTTEWWQAREKAELDAFKRKVRADLLADQTGNLPRGPLSSDLTRRRTPRTYGRHRA